MTLSKEQMLEAEMLNFQIERTQQYLEQLDKQMQEVIALKEAIQDYDKVEQGAEILAPLAAGMFMKATAAAEKQLYINVGNGVVVPKSMDEAQAMLDEQLKEMRRYEEELHKQFDELLAKMQAIEKEL